MSCFLVNKDLSPPRAASVNSKYAAGSNFLLNDVVLSFRKNSSGVLKSTLTFAAKSLYPLATFYGISEADIPVRGCEVIRLVLRAIFDPASCITNEERRVQIRTATNVEIIILKHLLPHPRSRLSKVVLRSGAVNTNRQVKISQDCRDPAFEVGYSLSI